MMEDRMLGELPWLAPIGALVLTSMLAVILALFVARERQGRVGAVVAGGHLVAAGLVVWVWLDLGRRELGALVPLIVLTVALGVYPRPALELISAGAWLLP